jgi:hypothetical protein
VEGRPEARPRRREERVVRVGAARETHDLSEHLPVGVGAPFHSVMRLLLGLPAKLR